MPKEKKRPSKNARAAQKILEESKLLSVSKELINTKADQTFKSTNAPIKTTAANKMRPDKKRG